MTDVWEPGDTATIKSTIQVVEPCRSQRRGLKAEARLPPTVARAPLRANGEGPISKVIVHLCCAPLDPPWAKVSTPWVILGYVVWRLLCTRPNAFCTILCLTKPLVPTNGSTFCGDTTLCRGGRQVGSLAARPSLLILALGESRGHGKDWTVTLEIGPSPSALRVVSATVGGGLASVFKLHLGLRQGPPSGIVLLMVANVVRLPHVTRAGLAARDSKSRVPLYGVVSPQSV